MSTDDGFQALQGVLDEYYRIAEFDELADDDSRYCQARGEIKGAWIIGSMAAGRWRRESDVDVWLCIEGLSDYGYDNLDWQIKENLELRGVRIITEDGVARKVDVIIMEHPPSKEYASITLQ